MKQSIGIPQDLTSCSLRTALLLLILINPVEAQILLTEGDSVIYDLNQNSPDYFDSQALSWTWVFGGVNPVKYFFCVGTGFYYLNTDNSGLYFTRTYSTLRLHYSVYIQFNVLMLDTWTSQEGIIFTIDGILNQKNTPDKLSPICDSKLLRRSR